jgi:hypothetical protein
MSPLIDAIMNAASFAGICPLVSVYMHTHCGRVEPLAFKQPSIKDVFWSPKAMLTQTNPTTHTHKVNLSFIKIHSQIVVGRLN